MGFLKFLKREKRKDELEEFDLPPAPPPLEGFDEDMPELPSFPDFGEERISVPEELPRFELPEEAKELGEEEPLPEFLAFPEERPMPPAPKVSAPPEIPEPVTQAQPMLVPEEGVAQEAKLAAQDLYPKIERRLFTQEKRILRERPSGKAIYIRVDRFKATLGSINMVRSDLRKSEEALTRLENIKNAKDKSFDKIKYSLDDLQKKLIFVDKTLFRGE